MPNNDNGGDINGGGGEHASVGDWSMWTRDREGGKGGTSELPVPPCKMHAF
jgi:hypothetical protein